MSTEFYWLAVAAVTITSASRLTRLATVDKFPPVMWVRNKYADITDGSDWQWLMFCGYCFSFWATAFVVVWGLLSGVYDPVSRNQVFDGGWAGWWWVVNSILAASYLAAILMAHDADPGDDD